MPRPLKVYPIALEPDLTLPANVWDPMWRDPHIASRMARRRYQQLRLDGVAFPPHALASSDDFNDSGYDQRDLLSLVFALRSPLHDDAFDVDLLCGSYGEIHRHYSFGSTYVDFHAQALCFGVDAEGRYFLDGKVGRFGGTWGKKAALLIRFCTPTEEIGSICWEAELDPPKDIEICITGQDTRLVRSFGALAGVGIEFYTFSPGP